MKTIQVYTIILDFSSSDISPSAQFLSTSSESQITTTTQTPNVTPITPAKRTRSKITDTSSISSSSISSSSISSTPPIAEIPITPHSQTSPNITPLVHIPSRELVERYVIYKQPTAIKTVRLQP